MESPHPHAARHLTDEREPARPESAHTRRARVSEPRFRPVTSISPRTTSILQGAVSEALADREPTAAPKPTAEPPQAARCGAAA